MTISPLRLCAAFLLLAGAAQFAQAQVITNGEIDRGLRFRGTPTHDGEPYTQRYSYSTGNGIFYLNGSSQNLRYLDYLDRVDRAIKFGYPMPIDPYFGNAAIVDGQVVDGPVADAPPSAPPARVFFGGGLGWFRRR